MATMRPHAKTWRSECGCWFTLAFGSSKEEGERKEKLNLGLDYQNQYKHLMDEVHPISWICYFFIHKGNDVSWEQCDQMGFKKKYMLAPTNYILPNKNK
jgi:hypothetical protein